jgi:excinuclease ABC subunit B
MTESMRAAITETERRRTIQAEFNQRHGIVPQSAQSGIRGALVDVEANLAEALTIGEQLIEIPKEKSAQDKLVTQLRKEMFDAAAKREFEKAAVLRDALNSLQERLLKM